MVGSHKILTVSYGTFSCTLEGFDDSFETMKAIAEYFRDLAADDRYFGAEPPQPDAEMLARIAEREIARRVEARMESSGIVLRVGQSLDSATVPAAPAEPAPVMPPASAVQAPVMQAPMAAPVAPVVQPAPAADSVAAKLQRIRAVVGKSAATPIEDAEAAAPARVEPSAALAALVAEASRAAPEPAPVAEPVTGHVPAFEEFAAGDFEADMAEDDTEMVAEVMAAFAEEDVESSLAAEIAEVEAHLPADEAMPDVVADAPVIDRKDDVVADVMAAFAEEEAESQLAAEIAVADAGMAEAVAEAPGVAELTEAEAAVPAQPIRARVIRMRKADFDRVVAEGALVSAEGAGDAADMPGADVAADMAEAADRDDGFDDLGDLAELADLTDGDDLADLMRLDGPVATLSEDDEAELLAELAAVENDTVETVPAANLVEVEDDLGAELAAIAAEMDLPEAAPVEDAAGTRPVRADEDEAIASVLRAMQDTPAPVETVAEVAEAVEFADEAVDDIAAEADSDLVAAFVEDEPAPVMPVAEEPVRPRFVAPEADEGALSRLLSETDAQMSGPDAARRREAIAQLRAAVAATEAARALGESQGSDDEETEDDFREDLRQAVRPRRPVVGQTDPRGERPRPAPLKLVASQRIDLPEPAAPAVSLSPAMGQPIRPRRVTVEQIAAAREAEDARTMATNPAAAAASADSFADFAERMGATSLADLLEAAAAYTAFVEGTGDFSRPQILRRVTQVSPETNKEDGLRLFGTLLREGRIRRSDRAGRFEVAEDTRFNPDRRAV